MAASNLFQQYLQPVRSVQDYANDMDVADGRRADLRTRTQQNALQALALQQTTRQMADTEQDRNALQRIASGWSADTTADQRIASLRNSGRAGLMTQADTLEKADIERSKGRAEAEKVSLNTALERQRAIADLAGSATDQVSWARARNMARLLGADVSQIPDQYDPQTAQQIAGIALTQMQRMEQYHKQLDQGLKERQFGETQRHNQASEGLTARGQDIGATTARRGQDMVDARTREQTGQGKVPAGYRQLPDGNLQAIPGGPADQKQIGALNADTQALTGSISSFDRLAAAANEVLQHPGLAGITGLRGALPNIPGGEAANAQALLGTLKSQVGFGVLQDMRNNSKTGGALGSVSDAEGKRLEANLAALDKSQSLEQYQANLRKIVDYAEQAKGRVREAYNLKHGNRALQPSEDHPPAINDLLKKYGG